MEDQLRFDLSPEIAAPLVLLCLLVSAFFSAGETAVTGASRPRLHRLEQQGNTRAHIINQLLERKETAIGGLLLGNNIVNILAAALTTAVLTDIFGDAGVFYATVVVTVLVVIFSEVLPKTYALLHPDRTALALAPSIKVALRVLSPLSRAITITVSWLMRRLRLMPRPHEAAEASNETLRGAIDLHGGHAAASPPEKAMLRSVLDLGDLTVASVMTHRQQVTLVDASQPVSKVVEQVLESPFTRVPLYRGEADNVVGVVHAKALFRAVLAHNGSTDAIDIDTVMGPPWFIPEATTLIDQLQAFRDRREHFALVVDEYGALRGIVTLEDILEEIVGEISDEHDLTVPGVELQPDGSCVCVGTVPIRDLNRELGWRLPEDVATTIAGLVLHEARRIPEVGQTYAFHGFRFEILMRERNQITKLRVIPAPPVVPEAAAA
jgi:Mg2+/Co2+ transporter CorB